MTKTCQNCLRPMEPSPLAARRAPHQRFCCKGCRQSWHESQRKLAGELQARLGKVDEGLFDRVAKETGVGREQVKLVIHALAWGIKE